MKVYRIVNTDGLYSSGGSDPFWTKKGKVWKNIGHVKNHLHQFVDYSRENKYKLFYHGSKVVEYEICENEIDSVLDPFYFIVSEEVKQWEHYVKAERLEAEEEYIRAKKVVEQYETRKHNNRRYNR